MDGKFVEVYAMQPLVPLAENVGAMYPVAATPPTYAFNDSASTASGVGSCSDKINFQLYKLIVELRDHPCLSNGVGYDNALKF